MCAKKEQLAWGLDLLCRTNPGDHALTCYMHGLNELAKKNVCCVFVQSQQAERCVTEIVSDGNPQDKHDERATNQRGMIVLL